MLWHGNETWTCQNVKVYNVWDKQNFLPSVEIDLCSLNEIFIECALSKKTSLYFIFSFLGILRNICYFIWCLNVLKNILDVRSKYSLHIKWFIVLQTIEYFLCIFIHYLQFYRYLYYLWVIKTVGRRLIF